MEEPKYHLQGVVKSREQMEDFDGPLDVILLLLSKNKIEIRDIQIAQILEQYLAYLEERKKMIPAPGNEEALFLSMQKKRMNVRSVENLVKKYSRIVTPLKKITPHKLRSTYGTNLYRETGDIYLVADVLGHTDVNTTKKHYAALEDERRRSARNKVKLREN